MLLKRYSAILLVLLWGCQKAPESIPKTGDKNTVRYSGDSLMNIAVPVGGIGTGDVLIGGRGNIRAFEIFNSSAMNDQPYMTFFSLWLQEGDQKAKTRIMEGRVPEVYSDTYGISRRQLEGIPRFSEAVFSCQFPFIKLELNDQDIPLKISGEFYNPLIPLNVDDSSLPIATFYWTLENPTSSEVSISIALNAGNPLKNRSDNNRLTNLGNTNSFYENGDVKGVSFSNGENPQSAHYGNLVIGSDYQNTEVQTAWYEGAWWDDATVFWDDFSRDGHIKERRDEVVWQGSNWYGSGSQTVVGCVLAHAKLSPGQKVRIPFYISWYVPNRILETSLAFGNNDVANTRMKNYYGTKFQSSADVLTEFLSRQDYMYNTTAGFTDILYSGSYPDFVIDAVSANTAALKTNLLMRTGEGHVHGFEGLGPNSGCCPGNCNHVWNYAQTMASLFPSLERRVREVSFLHDTFENGYQCFRTVFPLGDYWFKSVAADGQMGNIIRVYREWKYSGDSAWLASLWPKVKLALEFAWKGSGEVKGKYSWQENARIPWDPYKEGIMRGDQHNTYDINFFGPNMMTGSTYLAALKACSEMAGYMDEPEKASEYLTLYEKGLALYDSLTWNGAWYEQKVEIIEGVEIPERLESPPDEEGKIIPKYQFAGGCLTDQLLGQFIAFNAGLGFVIDPSRVKTAMASVYEHNFIRDFTTFDNVQRVFAINNESGVVICSWPKDDRPRIPFVYADEVWTGIEYGAAVNMINAGLVNEGLDVVRAVRERYRGHNRNPWGEVESGMYYARSLASWGILPALSGYRYDGINQSISFEPKISPEVFSTLWIAGSGWGKFSKTDRTASLEVHYGSLKLKTFGLDVNNITEVKLNSNVVNFAWEGKEVVFDESVLLEKGDRLTFSF